MYFSFTQQQLTKAATARHDAETYRLYRAIVGARGQFRLLFAAFNRESYRDVRITNLSIAIPKMQQVGVKDSAFEDFRELRAHLASLAPRYDALHVLGLEHWLAGDTAQWMAGFNYQRETLASDCPTALVLWLPESVLSEFAVVAADAWAWRGGVFDFVLPVADLPRLSEEELEYAETEGQRKRRRIQALATYFAKHGDAIAPELYASLLQEKGQLHRDLSEYLMARGCFGQAYQQYFQMGDVQEAAWVVIEIARIDIFQGRLDEAYRKLSQQALPVLLAGGNQGDAAAAQGYIAEILTDWGQLDEALQILQEKVAPIHEHLGQERNWAVAMVRIADILRQQGELDAALQILQQQALPVLERLGELRERASALIYVAMIMEKREEYDEALRILQQEALPIFERIGDIQSQAVVLSEIADILAKQSELEAALNHYQRALPMLERLEAIIPVIRTRKDLAKLLMQFDPPQPEEANRLLCLASQDARRLRISDVEGIEELLTEYAMTC